jgi:hypothetical protein
MTADNVFSAVVLGQYEHSKLSFVYWNDCDTRHILIVGYIAYDTDSSALAQCSPDSAILRAHTEMGDCDVWIWMCHHAAVDVCVDSQNAQR